MNYFLKIESCNSILSYKSSKYLKLFGHPAMFVTIVPMLNFVCTEPSKVFYKIELILRFCYFYSNQRAMTEEITFGLHKLPLLQRQQTSFDSEKRISTEGQKRSSILVTKSCSDTKKKSDQLLLLYKCHKELSHLIEESEQNHHTITEYLAIRIQRSIKLLKTWMAQANMFQLDCCAFLEFQVRHNKLCIPNHISASHQKKTSKKKKQQCFCVQKFIPISFALAQIGFDWKSEQIFKNVYYEEWTAFLKFTHSMILLEMEASQLQY
ncbi:hypothetical protein RFI_31038 [Reticulomyxa filosa]|uniref:Uncharacterized protein n=1 Tax=Reticulomyxa filosa TaxID=46433 RepID=X6LWQ6_RETFI|nr:hypothetical protein RFI_31038 [Reticulomyxa filosa]|eukprot:ETO06358.1 hypothetical protein RFI_31038 [Reticulomyxa filosa]